MICKRIPLSAKYCSKKDAFSFPVVASVSCVFPLKNLTDILSVALFTIYPSVL